jgi:hypothetical protein
MYPPIMPGRDRGSPDDDRDREERLDTLSKGYEGSPWLGALVTFTGFLAAFAGSLALLFTLANLGNGTVWVPYAVVVAVLVGAHLSMRALRFWRRRSRGIA